MKRWFRVFIISVFALSAISLVVIQSVQTRRTFSISDNMFNVSVNNAMDEVIKQLDGEINRTDVAATAAFNYQELDSLIYEELLINGIDLHPVVGLYDDLQASFLYSSDPRRERELETSPYRYNFHPVGVVSSSKYFITLSFPETDLFLQKNTKIYVYMTLFLVMVIALMFFISLRTIANQRKLDMMKSEFINNMTHEIKTPISTIGLACEMLQDSCRSSGDMSHSADAAAASSPMVTDSSQLATYIGIISDENQRMRLLVETILQSAKMSNKNFSISLKPMDINPVIEHVKQSFKLTLGNRGGSIETYLDAPSSIVLADELHITNLVYNLVDNGIKYSEKAPLIVIRTSVEKGKLLLSVQDHGIGISKADQRHVFEKFYRVSTGNVHNVKGFGIGLNYVAQVTKLHHGHVSLDSELGKGSTFTVAIPLA